MRCPCKLTASANRTPRGKCSAAIVGLICLVGSTVWAELVPLTVESGTFPDPSSVSVFVDAAILGDDVAESSISGQLLLDLQPSAINPETAQVTVMDLTLTDAVDIQVGGGLLFPVVSVTAEPESLMVSLVQPADANPIFDDQFEQFDTLVGLAGVVQASVVPDPLDLAEEDPTSVDFESISITADRSTVALGSIIKAQVEVPIEVGPLTVNIFVDVDGEFLAVGEVPAATYVWKASAAQTAFSDSAAWLRGDAAGTNSLPSAIDTILFPTTDGNQHSVDLGSNPAVSALRAEGETGLANGALTIVGDGESAVVDTQSLLAVMADAKIESSLPIEVTGGGELRIDGEASQLVVLQAAVGGDGTVNEISVEPESALRLRPTEKLNVVGELAVSGRLEVEGAAQAGEGSSLLAEAGSIETSGSIFIDGIELDSAAEEVHLVSGLFGSLSIQSTQITLNRRQAIPGDADGNGTVDFADFLVVSGAFGTSGDWPAGDFDGNMQIEFADFLILSNNFGAVEVVSVPEPTRIMLLAWTLVAFLLACRQPQREKGAAALLPA